MKIRTVFFVPILLMFGVSCGPTTETIQAPFKLTSDVTSSTSNSTALPDPTAKARQRLEHFVTHAYDGVSCDIAQGHGEYLTSLAVLAGIPTDAQPAFQREIQNRYAELYDPLLLHKEARTQVVNHAWSAGYGKLKEQRATGNASGLPVNLSTNCRMCSE